MVKTIQEIVVVAMGGTIKKKKKPKKKARTQEEAISREKLKLQALQSMGIMVMPE